MTRRILVLLGAAAAWAPPAAAQADASVGLGVGTVRYPEGTSFSSATLSPALRYMNGSFAVDVAGSVSSLPGGVWSTQGRGDVWGVTPPVAGHVRIGLEAILAGTTLGSPGSSAEAHGLAELLFSARDWGVGFGAGPSTGGSSGELPVVALHTRLRSWWHPARDARAPDVHLSVEPTHFPDGWFTDATLGASLERRRAVGSLWISGRVSSVFGSKLAGGAYARLALSPRVDLELTGGGNLSNPYQGFPRAGFLAVGVRLRGAPRSWGAVRAPLAPLVPERRGKTLVVQFHMAGARSVAMAGDWNGWQAMPLRALGGDVWEGALTLAPGLYHFNLQVDEQEWVVPKGVTTVPDGLGGMVAVLIVP